MVSVRTPAIWIKDLRDIAWSIGVRSCSYRHLVAYGIKLALTEHTTKFWQEFFFNGEDYILELYIWLDGNTCKKESQTQTSLELKTTPKN